MTSRPRKRNRDKWNAYMRAYRATPKARATKKAWYERNRKDINKQSMDWQRANPEKRKQYRKAGAARLRERWKRDPALREAYLERRRIYAKKLYMKKCDRKREKSCK